MDESELKRLAAEWERYCREEYPRWAKENPLPFPFVWNPGLLFDYAHERHSKWIKHMKTMGEQWWRPYGYRLIWPDNDHEALRLEEIETTAEGEGP